jgi:hypothetical protein
VILEIKTFNSGSVVACLTSDIFQAISYQASSKHRVTAGVQFCEGQETTVIFVSGVLFGPKSSLSNGHMVLCKDQGQ